MCYVVDMQIAALASLLSASPLFAQKKKATKSQMASIRYEASTTTNTESLSLCESSVRNTAESIKTL